MLSIARRAAVAAAGRRLSRPFSLSHAVRDPTPAQSESRHAPIGVTAALEFASNIATQRPHAKIFQEFSLADRVAVVSGGNRGLGLEMALALAEAGARAVYCLDLPPKPSEEFMAVQAFASRMERPLLSSKASPARVEYVSLDVTSQLAVLRAFETIGASEGRVDACIAAAGILKPEKSCLEYDEEEFREVLDANTCGVLFTAQAAGREMVRYGTGGSIILIASMSGSITNKVILSNRAPGEEEKLMDAQDHAWVSYNTSKSAVLQMARSMACELAPQGIRVNSLSPGHIYTKFALRSSLVRYLILTSCVLG